MSRRNSPKNRRGEKKGADLEAGAGPDIGPVRSGESPSEATLPGNAILAVISLAIVLHLAALFLSYSAIIEPSSTHSALLESATPYLRSTHFSADGRPFYLAHDTPDERPHRLQYASCGDQPELVIDTETEWTTIEPSGVPGMAASDRYHRWVALAATLAESDRASLVASLLLPLVDQDDKIDAIRIMRLPTQLTTVVEDSEPPVYLGRVVRTSGRSRLISVGAKRLSTYSRRAAPDPAGEDTATRESPKP